MVGQRVSIIIRALNEERWLSRALDACKSQVRDFDVPTELVLVDSGSTDSTIDIARRYGCRIVHIDKAEFTFGRSLNRGCDAASGDILVFLSAHCIPTSDSWLENLTRPLTNGACQYAYGRQVGHEISRFSEHRVFAHYYGEDSLLPQQGFFCNNANSAIPRSVWSQHRFDEIVTGLEDMVLAKTIVAGGGKIGYVADAPVVHIHEETLQQTCRRYYREALTMRSIMPEVHFHVADMLRCFAAGTAHDLADAARARVLFREAAGIIGFRFMQYWGTYRGHNEHRALSQAQKMSYYYPRAKRKSDATSGLSIERPARQARIGR